MSNTASTQHTSPNAATLTDAEFELADRIEAVLAQHPGWHTPSRIATWAKSSTSCVRTVLEWMAAHQNGAQHDGSSYGIRHFSSREA